MSLSYAVSYWVINHNFPTNGCMSNHWLFSLYILVVYYMVIPHYHKMASPSPSSFLSLLFLFFFLAHSLISSGSLHSPFHIFNFFSYFTSLYYIHINLPFFLNIDYNYCCWRVGQCRCVSGKLSVSRALHMSRKVRS